MYLCSLENETPKFSIAELRMRYSERLISEEI